jgi:hypothetical protein
MVVHVTLTIFSAPAAHWACFCSPRVQPLVNYGFSIECHSWSSIGESLLRSMHELDFVNSVCTLYCMQALEANMAEMAAERLCLATACSHRTCSHIGCSSMQGASEPQLGGQGCSRCKTAVYCGRDCQRADWPQHKEGCGLLLQQGNE